MDMLTKTATALPVAPPAAGPASGQPRGTESADIPPKRAQGAPSTANDAAGEEATAPQGLEDAVRKLSDELNQLGSRRLDISYREEASRFVVSVVDAASGEEIRQIPDESLVELSERLGELRGFLLDQHG